MSLEALAQTQGVHLSRGSSRSYHRLKAGRPAFLKGSFHAFQGVHQPVP